MCCKSNKKKKAAAPGRLTGLRKTCGTCKGDIVLGIPYTEVEGTFHHTACLRCECKLPLGQQFKVQGDKIYCPKCYPSGAECRRCQQRIPPGEQFVKCRDGDGTAKCHLDCTTCYKCKTGFSGGEYEMKNGEIHCAECAIDLRDLATADPDPPKPTS